MRRFSTTLAIAISTLLFVSICSAQQAATTSVPNLVRYSGTLKDAQGAALSSSTAVGVTFSVYKQQDGGASVWMETQNVTPDANGQYNVILGSTTATGLPDDLFLQQEQRWLGVQVQGEAEQARVLLVSVPYAFKAHEAETLGGLPASAFVKAPPSDGGSTSTGTGTAVNAVANASGNPSGKGKAGKDTILGPCTVTPGFITYWDNTGALCASKFFQNLTTGNIGIGLTNPSEPLDVKGVISTYQWYDINENRIVSVGNIPIASSASTNLFLGWNSGTVNNGNTNNNTFTGRDTGPFNNLGHDNTFSGYRAGFGNVNGNGNSCFGSTACLHNTAGIENVAVGAGAGFRNETGSRNTFVGTDSAFGILSQSNGSNNTITGWEAGFTNMSGGNNNVFYGYQAGVANTTGSNNVFYGYQAGSVNTTGSNNVYLAHFGVAAENHTMRIGMNGGGSFQVNRVFMEPINSHNTPALNRVVTINLAGQLGFNTITGGGNVNGTCTLGANFLVKWMNATGGVECSNVWENSTADHSVGIGTTTPVAQLDVRGEINAGAPGGPKHHYQIINQVVLSIDGQNNTLVGVGPNSGGTETVIIGTLAGVHNTGISNTFVGYEAGVNNHAQQENTFLGAYSGLTANAGIRNTFVGYGTGGAGFSAGNGNVFLGWSAGNNNSVGTSTNDIYIGNLGSPVAGTAESQTIRIGNNPFFGGAQTNTYIAGIWNSAVGTPPFQKVCVDAAGKLFGISGTLDCDGTGSPVQGVSKTQQQVIEQQQQQIESLQKQNAEFQQRLSRLESLIAQK